MPRTSKQVTHTKGPWKVSDDQDTVYAGNLTVAQVKNLKDCIALFDEQRAEANARLIAEAPALLEALRALVESCGGDEDDEGNETSYYSEKALDTAKALLQRIERGA